MLEEVKDSISHTVDETPPTGESLLQLLEIHPELDTLFPAADKIAERIGV